MTERNRSNRPFPYSKSPHFKKARPCARPHFWKWISFAWELKNRFHIKDFAHFSFVLKQGLGTTWNRLIMKRNETNNTNWIEENQLDIYNLGWGFNQIQPAVRAGIEARVFGLQVQRPNPSATLPPTLEALISALIFQFSSYLSSPVHFSSDTLADLHYKTRSIDVEFSLKKQP